MSAATSEGAPPRALTWAVALIAAAMLFEEVVLTRIFSVIFFYHFSFLAVSMAMSGLAFGGVIAARWDVRGWSDETFRTRTSVLALVCAGWNVAALGWLMMFPDTGAGSPPTAAVVLLAAGFVPGLVAAGTFLACAFARREQWIGRLYSADLIAAALACLAAIYLLRTLYGPVALLVPIVLSAVAGLLLAQSKAVSRAGWVVAGAGLLLIALHASGTADLIHLAQRTTPNFERWNEHSRITVTNYAEGRHQIVIDKSAATDLYEIPPRTPGGPIPIAPAFVQGVSHVAYRLGRPMERTAVIGVGGGRDIMAALAGGARHVDGYELNNIIADLLLVDYAHLNSLASYPEVDIIHSEARVGIAHSNQQYDVIQASLIDTWAATASGGFVLSESGLYTVEGWRIMLERLTASGILTMTRWYLPRTPAETQRLLSLAVASLADQGITDPLGHIILVSDSTAQAAAQADYVSATILVSKQGFTADEVQSLQAVASRERMHLIAAPGVRPSDPTMARLMTPGGAAQAVADSPYDISAPTDLRPYFFLPVRPTQLGSLLGDVADDVLASTFAAVRSLLWLCGLALLLTVALLLLAFVTVPAPQASHQQQAIYRRMGLYFAGIGFGYILVQLGMHQRLILMLGNPTTALSVVLFSMLLGTGAGAALSTRLFPEPRQFILAWTACVVGVGALVLGLPLIAGIEQLESAFARETAARVLMGGVGFLLGFGFPLGVRLVAPAGEWSVQRMWAVNGAASIAGSALTPLLGMTMGSRAVLAAGLGFYLVALGAGVITVPLVRSGPDAIASS